MKLPDSNAEIQRCEGAMKTFRSSFWVKEGAEWSLTIVKTHLARDIAAARKVFLGLAFFSADEMGAPVELYVVTEEVP